MPARAESSSQTQRHFPGGSERAAGQPGARDRQGAWSSAGLTRREALCHADGGTQVAPAVWRGRLRPGRTAQSDPGRPGTAISLR